MIVVFQIFCWLHIGWPLIPPVMAVHRAAHASLSLHPRLKTRVSISGTDTWHSHKQYCSHPHPPAMQWTKGNSAWSAANTASFAMVKFSGSTDGFAAVAKKICTDCSMDMITLALVPTMDCMRFGCEVTLKMPVLNLWTMQTQHALDRKQNSNIRCRGNQEIIFPWPLQTFLQSTVMKQTLS